jgi:hypothetical protein
MEHFIATTTFDFVQEGNSTRKTAPIADYLPDSMKLLQMACYPLSRNLKACPVNAESGKSKVRLTIKQNGAITDVIEQDWALTPTDATPNIGLSGYTARLNSLNEDCDGASAIAHFVKTEAGTATEDFDNVEVELMIEMIELAETNTPT